MSIWFFTTNETVANKASDMLNTFCGYPNPATKTDRAVNITKHPTQNWWILPIPEGIYAPKVLRYLDARGILPANRRDDLLIDTVAEAQAKLQELRNSGISTTDDRFFCLITQNLVDKGGFFV